MPSLLTNLQSVNLQVKEAAVNTLATLINSSPEHAVLVSTEHVLSVLVSLLQVQVRGRQALQRPHAVRCSNSSSSCMRHAPVLPNC